MFHVLVLLAAAQCQCGPYCPCGQQQQRAYGDGSQLLGVRHLPGGVYYEERLMPLGWSPPAPSVVESRSYYPPPTYRQRSYAAPSYYGQQSYAAPSYYAPPQYQQSYAAPAPAYYAAPAPAYYAAPARRGLTLRCEGGVCRYGP